jgi:hypothetical protein
MKNVNSLFSSVKLFNKQAGGNQFEQFEVVRFTSQVVAGLIYQVNPVLEVENTCTQKSSSPYLTPANQLKFKSYRGHSAEAAFAF